MTAERAFAALSLVLLLAGCAATPGDSRQEEETDAEPSRPAAPEAPVTPAPAAPPVAPKPDIRTLSFALVGDMMLGTDYPENHLPDDDGVGFLAPVTSRLRAADVTIGNLEGVLQDGGEPVKECSNPQACYLFRSPAHYAQHFASAGFDVMSVANNHARDFGEDGRSSSMAALAAAGIAHTGRRGDFASLERYGLKIAVLGFSVTRNSNLLHDYDRAAQTISSHAESHDIVVVTFHGGAEGDNVSRLPFAEETYYGEPRGDVVRFARLAVDAGADLVFGHGPHVVRAMELYRDRLIAYSLGNFATYYGISVKGLRGIAPILEARIDYRGRFLDGQIFSTQQVRPGGPQPDPGQQALREIRTLSKADFAESGLDFGEDGRLERR